MPFERPTLAELLTRIREDFRSRLGISGALVRRAMADVLAAVWTGSVHMLHGHLDWLAEQLFGDTAEEPFLSRRASLWDITKTPASFADGTATATGTNGLIVSSGTVFVRDDGATYTATADSAAISGGTTTVSIQATEAGADGNLDPAETLTFESPVAGIDSTITIDDDGSGGGLTGGVDEETTEQLRQRFLLRLREPPTGGSDQDYVAWALEVPGVTRAWVFRHENGLGTVVVRFVRDGESPIFPSAGEVTDVQTKLDSERPVTAEVTAEAPVQLDVDFDIELSPDTAAIQTAVEAALEDLLTREAEPGDGAGSGTIPLTQIQTAIGVAVGDGDYTLNSPSANVVPALGELAVLGTVTFS
jgi:uncharacterized phage protein gp47/JayE